MQLGLPLATSAGAPASPDIPEFYFVRHRRARRYLLRVDLDGRVRVTIPRGGSRREAEAFARRNLPWIARQQQQIPPSVLSPDDRATLRARAAAELPIALRRRADALGLPVGRVSIRNQRSRWGSCARDGRITLNWRLLAMPEWVRDYVIVHELMHLKRMDHSPEYWRLVEGACPEYRKARHWLKVHGPGLR